MKAPDISVLLLFVLFQSLLSTELVNFRTKRSNDAKQSQEHPLQRANENIRKIAEEMLRKKSGVKESSKSKDFPEEFEINTARANGGDSKRQEEEKLENVLSEEIFQLLEILNDLMTLKFEDLQLSDNPGVVQEEEIQPREKEGPSFKTFDDFIKAKFPSDRPKTQEMQRRVQNSPSAVKSKTIDTFKSDKKDTNEENPSEMENKSFSRRGGRSLEKNPGEKEMEVNPSAGKAVPNQAKELMISRKPKFFRVVANLEEAGKREGKELMISRKPKFFRVVANLEEAGKREKKELLISRKPKMSDRPIFLSPQRQPDDKKLFPEITRAFGVIYQSPSDEGKDQLLNKMLDSSEHKSLDAFDRKATLGDVFVGGETRPSFPEIPTVLAGSYPSVSPDDNDRLDNGLPATKEDKIDEMPGEAANVIPREENPPRESEIENGKADNIVREFLELDERRSLGIIDPILKSLRKNFVAINQQALLRNLRTRSHVPEIPNQSRTNPVDFEKRVNPSNDRRLESMAILRSLRSTTPRKLDEISVEGLFNAISPNKFVETHLGQI